MPRTILFNCARTRLEQDRHVSTTNEVPEPEVGGPDPLPAMADAEVATIVRAWTWDLVPHARDAIRLRYLDGLTFEQVGSRLGVTAASPNGAIRRARAALHNRLTEVYGDGLV